jgi:hypothetical protein
MTGTQYTLTAYALGFGVFVAYALCLWRACRATAPRDGERS